MDPSYGARRWCAALSAAGLRDASHCRDLVVTFEQPDTDHQIVFVPRTGRIQLRLGPTTPHEQRLEAAHGLYDWLRVTLAEAAP